MELVGVMGVVIVDLRPMIGTLVLESAAGAGDIYRAGEKLLAGV